MQAQGHTGCHAAKRWLPVDKRGDHRGLTGEPERQVPLKKFRQMPHKIMVHSRHRLITLLKHFNIIPLPSHPHNIPIILPSLSTAVCSRVSSIPLRS